MKKYKIVLVVIIFAGIIYFAGKLLKERKPVQKDEESAIKVKRGDLSVSVNVSGIIKPLNIIELKSRASGRVIKVPVQKGDYLEEGALIVEIENAFAKNLANQTMVELNAVKARSEKLKIEFDTEKSRNQRLLKNAENNLAKAKLELQKANEKEEMKKALKENNIATESELLKQEVDIRFNINDIQEKIDKLSKKEPVPDKELVLLKKSLESAKSEYSLVLQYLELTKKPVVQEKVDVEKFGIKQAEQELVKVKEKIKTQEAREKEVIAAESEVLKKQEALILAENNLKDAIVTAPIPGLVLQTIEKGRLISSEMQGDSAGVVVAALADLSKVYINVKVDKKDINNIKTGKQVKIKTDLFPDNNFEGRVRKIIPVKAAAKNEEACELTVDIENPNALLRPGMDMIFNIVIREAKNVLFVPNDTIKKIEDRKILFVIYDGKLIRREVKTGLRDRGFTEIISGLNEGEVVGKREKTVEIDISGGNNNMKIK